MKIKHKIWLVQIPIVALFVFFYQVTELGMQGELDSKFVREYFYPPLKRVSTTFTDWKFNFRGKRQPKSKIIVVEIDSEAIESYGRWPWHRNHTAKLIDQIFDAGAKVVGLDIVFSEADQRVPQELGDILVQNKLEGLVPMFETDNLLKDSIERHKDHLVLGWMAEPECQPAYLPTEECPVVHEQVIANQMETAPDMKKYAFSQYEIMPGFDPQKTPINTVVYFLPNIPLFSSPAKHSGYLNVIPDPDGCVRRIPLMLLANSRPYPSLPMEVARVGLNEDFKTRINARGKVEDISFVKSGKRFVVSPLGVMDINFSGKRNTYTYVPARDVIEPEDQIRMPGDSSKTVSKKEIFKDAYVLVGLSAIGVFDMRAQPFDSNIPGVEIHANILDNILNDDAIVSGGKTKDIILLFGFMVLFSLLYAYAAERLEAKWAMILFGAGFAGTALIDLKVLFNNNINWNTAFFYIEFLAIFTLTVAIKYLMEEKNKKFIKGAFSKYVAPSIVDAMLKDPEKLTVGGEKKELTIMFSDIRSFTTFSEKMDAKALSQFLNDYLGMMTGIVFANEGTLDKYIGDAVMAFWGAPVDQPKHAANACKGGVKMMQALAQNYPRYKEQYGLDIHVGMGINSGAVSVGNMGSSTNFAYTVLGDSVNLASRLEGLTKYYHASILTTRFTFDSIQKSGEPYPPHRTVDLVKVKGKKNAVEMIQVLEKEYAQQGLKLFEEGRQLYLAQKWDESSRAFKEAATVLSDSTGKPDETSLMYLERNEEFKLKPPGTDWDGSWVMTSK